MRRSRSGMRFALLLRRDVPAAASGSRAMSHDTSHSDGQSCARGSSVSGPENSGAYPSHETRALPQRPARLKCIFAVHEVAAEETLVEEDERAEAAGRAARVRRKRR